MKNQSIIIRNLTQEDCLPLLHEMKRNRDHLIEWLDFIDSVNLESQRRAIQHWDEVYRKGDGFEAGIFIDDKICGMVGLRIDRANDRGEIGYWLSKDQTGKGIATMAVKQVLEIGFKTYRLHKIIIQAVDGNRKSREIPKRLGFKFEGILREHYKLHGRYRDLYNFSITEKEWRLFYEQPMGSSEGNGE